MKHTITIKDVAKETNLAISTISKYMNGGNVRPQNRILIEEAVGRLGYQPDKAARGLRNAKTYTVGVVINYMESQFFSKIVVRIERLLRERGYSMLLSGYQNNPKQAEEAARFLANEQVDGCIIVSLMGENDFLKPMQEAKMPVLLLDRAIREKGASYDVVMSSAVGGAYDAVEYLIKKGHKDIAVISGAHLKNQGGVSAEERLSGYCRALEDYGIPVYNPFIRKGDFSFRSGYNELHKLWGGRKKPTAIFAANYSMALGAMAAIHELGINIPGELSFVMFDDLEFSTVTRPKLTAVRQPIEEIAEHAVLTLIRRMNGEAAESSRYIRLKMELIERESVQDLNQSS